MIMLEMILNIGGSQYYLFYTVICTSELSRMYAKETTILLMIFLMVGSF